jgi:Inner centromere protein, ARK binding region
MSGAPIRQSNMGKKPTIFSHGYAPAPSGPHMTQAENQLRQFPQPPNPHRIVHASEMSKYANGNKIPFAEAPNPPAYSQIHHKTPSSQHHHQPAPKSTLQLVKSSPQPQQYTPGETIALPEIPTDSESDPDDDDGDSNGAGAFPVPSWASPTTLTTHLMAQESVDGDAVFGPIAPLRMEEIFGKGNKERLKKFRERTSSANWASSGDGLTAEEVRRDREMRDRMRMEGGWRYGS